MFCNATNSREKYDVRVGLFGSSTFEVQFAACQNGDISYLFSRCAYRITFGKIYIELRKTCFFCRKSYQHFYTKTLTHENKHIFRFLWIFVENRIAFLCDLPYCMGLDCTGPRKNTWPIAKNRMCFLIPL